MNIYDIAKIYHHHKLVNGTKRIFNEIYENYFFDLKYKTLTRKLRFPKDYNASQYNSSIHKWYQPTFYTPLKKISIYLDKILNSEKDLSNFKNTIIFDLGTGYGKPLLILNKFIKKNNFLFGVELDSFYKEIFDDNLNKLSKNFQFLNTSVEDLSFEEIFKNYSEEFILIIHNKNSFSYEITKNNFDILKNISKKIPTFYIYSNPEFIDIFKNEKILFQNTGWHVNYNINLYKI